MKTMKNNAEENIAEFENYLNHSLTQIRPDPIFVVNLQKRLSTGPSAILERKTAETSYLMIAAAVFSGLFLFWLIRYLIRKFS
jgi:hypothetical protein